MNNQKSNKVLRFATVLLAITAVPALLSAQSVPTTIRSAKKPAVGRTNTVTPPAQPAVTQTPTPTPTDNTPATTDAGGSAGQAPATVNTPVQAVQPVVSNTPASATTADPATQVQNGINQVNEKKQKAKSIWRQIKTIKK
jgi:hypothetical protein